MRKLSLLLVLLLVLSLSAVSFAQWVDGTYEGWSDAARNSHKHAKVYIQEGKIVGVTLREFTARDVEKDWNTYSWEQAKTAAQQLPGKFVANQSAVVDIVTGATSSSEGYMQAVERALLKATPGTQSKYFDGVFLGRSNMNVRGYYEVMWVQIQNDQVVDITRIERVLPDMTFLNLEDYNWALGAARSAYINEAKAANPGEVDIMTGATTSFVMWNLGVKDALDKARIR